MYVRVATPKRLISCKIKVMSKVRLFHEISWISIRLHGNPVFSDYHGPHKGESKCTWRSRARLLQGPGRDIFIFKGVCKKKIVRRVINFYHFIKTHTYFIIRGLLHISGPGSEISCEGPWWLFIKQLFQCYQ